MISIQIFVPHIHVTYGFETEERSLKGDTDPYITCKSVETFQHLTTNSNYVFCYNAESSHLEMVKIVGSWCLSQYSFSGIDIFHAVRGLAVPMSYSTKTSSVLCTENSMSKVQVISQRCYF